MAGKTSRATVQVIMKDIEYFPGETRYHMVAEVPNSENAVAVVVRDMHELVKLSKDSKGIHPYVAQLMVSYVKQHLAQVHLA